LILYHAFLFGSFFGSNFGKTFIVLKHNSPTGDKMGLFGKKPVVTVKVEGMSCNHCVMRVTKVLEELQGVKKAKVDLEKKKADITLVKEGSVSTEALINAVNELGFKASKN